MAIGTRPFNGRRIGWAHCLRPTRPNGRRLSLSWRCSVALTYNSRDAMKDRLATSVGVALLGVLFLAGPSAQDHHVQVGLCTPLKDIDAARTAGFEYFELGTSEIAALSDADFESAAAHIKQL